MRLETLFDTLKQRTERECAEIRSSAEREALTILEEAHNHAALTRQERLAAQAAELDAQLAAARERFQTDVAREQMAMRHVVVNDVLEQVTGQLHRIADGPEFGAVIEVLLAESVAAAPEAFLVYAPEAHAPRCRAWLQQHGFPEAPVEALPGLSDGVILSDLAGSFRITNTLATRFERLKREARRLCLARLYGETGR